MGYKYIIKYSSYPWRGEWEDQWDGNNYKEFLAMLNSLHAKYPIIDIEIRNFEDD